MQLVVIAAAQWFLYYDVVYEYYFCEDSTISNTLAALVGYNTCLVKKLSCTRHKNLLSSTPVLCSESHLIFPWLKSPIIIQSPLFTLLIALCIFSLFCLVMVGQRYTHYSNGNCCMSCN